MLRKKLFFLLSLGLLLSLFLLPASIQAQALESAPATNPVLRSDRLIHFMEQEVAANKMVGGVNLVFHKGEMIHNRTFGYQDRESNTPMRPDALFYIQSMTKPIVSVAFMMLYEEGHFELSDPVSKYLPEFEEQEVAQFEGEDESGKMTKIPAENPITIKQVLSHTTGKRHGIMGSELDKLYVRQLYLRPHKTIGERVESLAGLPLEFEPGTAWSYSASPDILALLIEQFSGMTCAEFLQKRLFDPLEMNDTGYNVPAEKQNRITTLYQYNEEGELELAKRQAPKEGTTVFGGTHGLFSTPADYMNFAQMLLNKGSFKGRQLLSPKTVELMTMNHVKDLYPEEGLGFGLGFAVVTDVAELAALGSEGTFYWNGAYNTYFFVDPAEELISVFMTQVSPYLGFYERKHRHFIYQGIEE